MRVLHFILGKADKNRANGVNQVIAGLAKYSARQGAEVRVIGKAETAVQEGERLPRDGFQVEAYTRWAAPLKAALERDLRWADLVHLHGVYAPWNIRVARMAIDLGRPYFLTLHDGLAPEREEARHRLRKRIFHAMIQRSHLESAAGIQVLAEEEGTELLARAAPRRLFCIPNGVDLEEYPAAPPAWDRRPGPLRLGYLGRLSAEKNLEALCEAFAAANGEGAMELRLAGPETPLGQALASRYGSRGVSLAGPRFGADKQAFIQDLDLFIHPSRCDVFSIAAMEVLALGTPLLITRTSKVSHFADQGAFFLCEPTVFGLRRGIARALADRHRWPAMAEAGRGLVARRFNWDAAARDLLEAYGTILAEARR